MWIPLERVMWKLIFPFCYTWTMDSDRWKVNSNFDIWASMEKQPNTTTVKNVTRINNLSLCWVKAYPEIFQQIGGILPLMDTTIVEEFDPFDEEGNLIFCSFVPSFIFVFFFLFLNLTAVVWHNFFISSSVATM